jgi:hypothetical protein
MQLRGSAPSLDRERTSSLPRRLADANGSFALPAHSRVLPFAFYHNTTLRHHLAAWPERQHTTCMQSLDASSRLLAVMLTALLPTAIPASDLVGKMYELDPKSAEATRLLPEITRMAASETPQKSLTAAHFLGEMGLAASNSALALSQVATNKSRPTGVRYGAAYALSKVAPQKSDTVPVAASLVRDTDYKLRMLGVDILAQAGPSASQAVESLLAAYESESSAGKVQIVHAFEAIKSPSCSFNPSLRTQLPGENKSHLP